MPAELRMTATHYGTLHDHLLRDDAEHAAILICGVNEPRNEILACREVVLVGDEDLDEGSGRLLLHVSPLIIARAAKRAAQEGLTVVVCHSHPFPGPVEPSMIDLDTELELCGRVLPGRLAGRPAGALILGPDGYSGRLWSNGTPTPLALRVNGRAVASPGIGDETMPTDQDARHLQIWGRRGQSALRSSSVAVVGVGGTGSHVAIQLAHLGVGNLVLVDPDVVEASNLNRLIGAEHSDVGRLKVDVIADAVQGIRPEISVLAVAESVVEVDGEALADSDLIICCTDGHGSRALLTEMAAQYLVPLIDLGVEVQAAGSSTRAGGGVRVVRPGDPCLHCMGILDSALVREEFLTDAQQNDERERGYLRGSDEPAPSVVALNGVVASLAVLEALDQLLGLFARTPSRVLYRAEARSVTTVEVTRDSSCYVCGAHGLIGIGAARKLPRRPKEPRTESA